MMTLLAARRGAGSRPAGRPVPLWPISRPGRIRLAMESPASCTKRRFVMSILRNLAAANLPAHVRTEVQRMIVAGFDFARGRIVWPDVARHTSLPLRHKFDGGDELRRLIAVTARIHEPQRRAVPVGQRLPGQDRKSTRLNS